MNRVKFTTLPLVAAMIFTCAALTMIVRAQSATQAGDNSASMPDLTETKFSFASLAAVNVANIEELYSAVNNPANAGNQIVLAPGVYSLSVNDPNGAARPNGGRIELQENMSLRGVFGNREAVVIDAFNLPASSYTAPPVTNVGAVRLGRGTNSVEWLTVRNAVNGAAGIETTIVSVGTAYVRVAHVIVSGNARGIDVRSFGAAAANRVVEAEIIDNDVYNNRITVGIGGGAGLRITNNTRADGAIINATLSGNRTYNNNYGFIVENVNTLNGGITVFSAGDRFYENGLGAHLGGGLNQTIPAGSFPANGNTVNFTANGDVFENNNGFNPNDRGGLFIISSANFSIPNGASNNTVNATLRNCRFANNQQFDIGAVGARSSPASIGTAGTNNRAKIRLYGALTPNISTTESIPDSPDAMNSVAVIRNSVVPSFDFDGDGRADLSVFRPASGIWYLNRNGGGFDSVPFGLATDKLAPADYDGDGKTDIAVYRAGTWYLRRSQLGFLGFAFGLPEDVPQPADFDGDGRAEIAVFRPSNGIWYVYNLATNQFTFFQLGTTGDKPAVGDYDGDGRADYAVFHPANGAWTIQCSSVGLTGMQFGIPTDKPVPADFDGDGKTDVAVFRPSDSNWYVWRSSSNNLQVVNWGLAGDAPVPADYDGDGKADVAVYRNGTWYIVKSSNGSISYQQFGANSDIPVAAANAQ